MTVFLAGKKKRIFMVVASLAWVRGRFSSETIAFLISHLVARYVRLLAPLTPLTHYAALCFATLPSLARSIHRLAHSLCSLVGQWYSRMCSRCKRVQWEQTRYFIFTRNTPSVLFRFYPRFSSISPRPCLFWLSLFLILYIIALAYNNGFFVSL